MVVLAERTLLYRHPSPSTIFNKSDLIIIFGEKPAKDPVIGNAGRAQLAESTWTPAGIAFNKARQATLFTLSQSPHPGILLLLLLKRGIQESLSFLETGGLNLVASKPVPTTCEIMDGFLRQR